jgi:uncharacterized protein (DUF2141 family)
VLLSFGVFLHISSAAHAVELSVVVSGETGPEGEIGCTLFADGQGFPMDMVGARQIWVPAASREAVCRFGNVAPGEYAVAVSRDLNGNRRLDTNFFGIPTEPWGVSNNVRPTLRAPRFEEAKVRIDDTRTTIELRIEK